MKVVLLSFDKSLRNQLKLDSFINNFSEFELFYFSIPTRLSLSDQNHLINQSNLFFQSQFKVNIQNHISVVNKGDIRKIIKKSKEVSWEIFFRFNNWVKVCDGIFDEDLDWFISGFTGKIIDFYSDDDKSIFMIAFSGDSLSKIPFNHLLTNDNNISPFYTFLEPEFILPDSEPENFDEDETQRIRIMLKLTNFQNLKTSENIDCFSELLQFWEGQFRKNLIYPVGVRIHSADQSTYQLKDIPYFDERFGVWGTLISDEKLIDIPIMKIQEITNNNFLNNLVKEYQKTMSLLLPS